ncbi:polyprenol monophosphomannose synthase [Agromyces endophyticus]|uniref:polyprenol monophosphomannose synthase n=1 Tax=Agromyces sp. H17E-10 TaxID=2932244 RepID=UPI001FCFEF64|nr:polyprenol monophosphomannose synthase [Agromyces sp. H17E-10]UOQ87583.1 polyprenol monophosphomannose synthase [Agromyces sp. H17E-10]
MSRRTVVILPTYNEIDSLPGVVARLRAAVPEADVLVVDDGSPDGTGELAEGLARLDPAIGVLHRPGKGGLGPAYLAAFARALAAGYDVIVQSDADGSHRPEDLPRLLAAIDGGADVAIGSRWVAGGAVRDWPWHRALLSRAGSSYAGFWLGMPQRDITGGFRAFRAEGLARLGFEQAASRGYCFQIEMLDRAVRSGCLVAEVPITFDERRHGVSKMSGRIVVEAFAQVTRWGLERLVARGPGNDGRAPASRGRRGRAPVESGPAHV